MPPKARDQFIEVDPADVYFSHSKIRPLFSCGRAVTQTLDDIQNGTLRVEDLPKITVITTGKDEHFYSLNNRRLWLFKQCRTLGLLPNNRVLVRVQPQADSKRLAQRWSAEVCSKEAKFFSERSTPTPNAQQQSPDDSEVGQTEPPVATALPILQELSPQPSQKRKHGGVSREIRLRTIALLPMRVAANSNR
eukprot:NODE_7175_length_786_cov_89.306184_g6936_i0.p1 GENE.NODE_7175_length_786_cov_89.306184_g6936_i0~~NODE_7175_length_786_cov_89.306184_g6936_i0.p1  ORF type:complete len:192 (+),score=15.30 NODE_7175_length_786_cov_89.306184_g6936_i0:117-692(+)